MGIGQIRRGNRQTAGQIPCRPKKSLACIERYDDFCFLYQVIIEQLQVFDPQGRLNDPQTAHQNIALAAQFLQQLQHEAISQEAKKLEKRLPDLLQFLHRAKPIVAQLEQQYPRWYLQLCSAAWQAQKNLIKAKSAKRRQYFRHRFEQYRQAIEQIPHLAPAYDRILAQLDLIVQSSAMVETINSIIRPYLNTSKNQVSQSLLNLIMFYHNNRIYREGKRKGYSPLQLLFQRDTQEDWVELLLAHIDQQFPEGLAKVDA